LSTTLASGKRSQEDPHIATPKMEGKIHQNSIIIYQATEMNTTLASGKISQEDPHIATPKMQGKIHKNTKQLR